MSRQGEAATTSRSVRTLVRAGRTAGPRPFAVRPKRHLTLPGQRRPTVLPAKAKGKGKKQVKYGNPAKAAQAQLESQQKKASAPSGAAFGQGAQDFDPSSLNLPAGFEKYLGKK